MSSIPGVLREARAEVIPRIPELVPYVADDKTVILQALQNHVGQAGVDIDAVSPLDWNKAERHAIAGYAIDVQKGLVLAGAGRDARLLHFIRHPHEALTPAERQLRLDLDLTMDRAGIETRDNLKERGLWEPMKNRYAALGAIAFSNTPLGPFFLSMPRSFREPFITTEGIFLLEGLQNNALGIIVEKYIKFIRKIVPGPESREKAAHDLSYLASGEASLHLATSVRRTRGRKPIAFRGAVSRSENGTFTMQRNRAKRGYNRNLPNVTLKCPATAVTTPAANDHSDRNHANYVQSLVYASLHEAPQYGCFD